MTPPTAAIADTPEATPSPTATPTLALLPGAVTQTPTPTPGPTGGEVEIRIPFAIYAPAAPPSDMPECVDAIPFRIKTDGLRTLIEGEGQIDCTFQDTPQGSPITYHVILDLDGMLNGELLPPTADRPSGWLDSYLALDGSIVQYYTGYPPQATNPCPESAPCRIPSADIVPLPFEFEEGSTINVPWTFILHLW